ncbi:MAG: hypothetical protein H6557_04980 [Lewinellaceae bacterium]|nr:hypothetical protein [Lewinellaceae bacterium]
MDRPNRDKLIRMARQYLSITKLREEQLNFYNGQLQERLREFSNYDSIENEIRLKSWIAYYDKYLITETKSIREEYLPQKGNFKILIDRNWRAFEFDQIFKSIDFLHKLISVTRKLRQDDIGFGESRTRKYVYEEARLHYYLAPYEELQVSHIYYASPGEIGFEGKLNTVKETKELVFDIIALEPLNRMVKNYWEIRRSKTLNEKEKSELIAAIAKAKTQTIEEEKRQLELQNEFELIHMDHELAKLERIEKAFDKFLSISDKIMEMEKRGFTNNKILENQLMSSVNLIQNLANKGKISLEEGKENSSE